MVNLKILSSLSETCSKSGARLVAVSKTKPMSDILDVYGAGQRIFGENKVQELTDKQKELPEDIEWHMIGHLQRNKVKYIAPFVSMIHSVDSHKLAKEINKQAKREDRVISVLLQVHIAEESTKFGFTHDELIELLDERSLQSYENIEIAGLMGMATFTEDSDQVRREFRSLKTLFSELKKRFFQYSDNFKEISMGMTGDYRIALDEGSTMIRVGSAIFGVR